MNDKSIRFLSKSELFNPSNNDEHTLHELCHAVTLGLMNHPGGAFTTLISNKIRDLPSQEHRDWNEILTCATEIRAALLLGWGPLDAESVLGDNIYGNMSERCAVARIEHLVWKESTYRRAVAAIRLSESLHEDELGWENA